MAQGLIRDFISELASAVDLPSPVYEFGSPLVAAHQEGGIRPLFAGKEFVGTDMRAGPGADRIEDLRRLSIPDGHAGTAICLDTLEHCEDPRPPARELHRVTAPGGICVVSSVMPFGIHGYPNHYFRFTPEGLRSMLGSFDHAQVAGIGDREIPNQVVGVAAKERRLGLALENQVVGVAAKGRRLGLALESRPSLAGAQDRWDAADGKIRVGPLRVPVGEAVGILAREGLRNARGAIARRRRG